MFCCRIVGISIILLALVTALPASSQEPDITEEESVDTGGWISSGRVYPFVERGSSTLGVAGGVLTGFEPARKVNALYSLNDTLWIGTDGGLFAYDIMGDSLIAIDGPLFNTVTAVTADGDGALWVGSEAGLSIRREGIWRHYTAEERRVFQRIRDIVRGDGRMWIGTFGFGCAHIAGDTLTYYSREDSLLDDRVLSIIEEPRHSMLFGTSSGLCRADSFHWESLRYGYKIPLGPVEDIAYSEEGDIFLAVSRQGVVRYSLGRVRHYRSMDGLPSDDIHSFSLDQTGRIWAAGSSGLSIYDGSGWIPFRPPEIRLSGSNVLSIHHDVDDNCFIGTDDGTVYILSRGGVRTILLPQVFPGKRIKRFRMFGGEIWCLTEEGLYRLDEELTEVELPDGWYRGSMIDFTVPAPGELWIATRFGILYFSRGIWQIFDRRQGLPTEYFTSVAVDTRGVIWIGTFDRGVLEFDGRSWIHYTVEHGLPDNRIEDLAVDSAGRPWILTSGGKTARFIGATWEEMLLPVPDQHPVYDTHKPDTAGMLDPAIRYLRDAALPEAGLGSAAGLCIGLDGMGNSVIGSKDRMYRFKESGWSIIDLPKGRESARPTAVCGTSRGELWLGTYGNGAFVLRRGVWHHVESISGLTGDHVLAIAEDAYGNVWLGTAFNGLNRFVPSSH